MKRLLYLFPLLLGAQEDFISHYEYGQMLYNNPRGVSCAQCHGKRGEGKVIVTYQDTQGKHALKGPDIRKKSYAQMQKSLNASHSVMPRYYLTDEEIKTIYDYIQKSNAKTLR
ncbi:Putative periplasmic protein [hydrothermal vent metagenome]|uniref:Putative periplasmic protein n=1 Tax=hydrothermal vent metagenome TaxID=652676 RepID=A0A1W1E927_9ZZZZ